MPYVDWSLTVGMHVAHNNHAWRDIVDIRDDQTFEGAKDRFQYSLDLNFAEFEFDWKERQVFARVLGVDPEASPLISTRWDFDLLSGKTAPPKSRFLDDEHFRLSPKMIEHGAFQDDFVCVAYRGPQTVLLKIIGFVLPVATASFLLLLPLLLPAIVAAILMRRKVSK